MGAQDFCDEKLRWGRPCEKRMMGEQNIYWNTEVYIQSVYGQQMKAVGGFPGGKRGLDYM
jgi:hypothetical protein